MKTFFLVLAGLCFLGFLFSISPWLGMVGIFSALGYYFSIKKPLPKEDIPESIAGFNSELGPQAPVIQEPVLNENSSEISNVPKISDANSSGGWGRNLGYIILVMMVSGLVRKTVQYFSTEARVAASQYSAWESDFKTSFHSNCKGAAVKSLLDAESVDVKSNTKFISYIEDAASEYCNCMVSKVESKHIIATKYNKYSKTQAQVEREIDVKISTYLASPDGVKTVEGCLETAVKVTSDRIKEKDRVPTSL